MQRSSLAVVVAVILTAGFGACGGDEPEAAPAEETTTTAPAPDPEPAAGTVSITGSDYAFEAEESIQGGRVEIRFTNRGKEPHFAGLAKLAEGKIFNDAKAVLAAVPTPGPPAGPPPFEEYAGVATVDPEGVGNATFNLPAGDYALFCALPAPDGVPHAGKGMIRPLTVTEGVAAALPESVASLSATDFALDGAPPEAAGAAVVNISNQGGQIHEVNLVELAPDKKIDDVVAWFKAPAGPPPMSFLSGVAIKPGEEGTSEFELEPGATYAFICAIPDARSGDFVPHVVKGMYTPAFTVS